MQKLIFVYNANSGFVNTIIEVTHKIFSPKTYNCNLCAITFDTFKENKDWKAYREESNFIMEFLHIDEFEKKHKNIEFIYPVILTKQGNTFKEFLSADKIKSLNSSEDLISVLKDYHIVNSSQ